MGRCGGQAFKGATLQCGRSVVRISAKLQFFSNLSFLASDGSGPICLGTEMRESKSLKYLLPYGIKKVARQSESIEEGKSAYTQEALLAQKLCRGFDI